MKKKSKLHRWGIGEYAWFIVLVILAIMIIYPMFWIIMSSFKDYNGIFKDVWGLPKEWLFENYKLAWEKGISNYFINSLIVSLGTIFGDVYKRQDFGSLGVILAYLFCWEIHAVLIKHFQSLFGI